MSNLNVKHPSVMSDQEVQIEIAELLEMEIILSANGKRLLDISKGRQAPRSIPNWPCKVDAAMKLQEHVPEEQRPVFMAQLFDIVYGTGTMTSDGLINFARINHSLCRTDTYWAVVHATARQRCEAFILTMRQAG